MRGTVLLSYRHSFHAGNFADVLKHIVLVNILESMIKKDKAFDYIDTHAGSGLYNLKSAHAQKLEEYTNGIGKLKKRDWPELASYFEVINTYNTANSLSFYPGSPLIAMSILRPQDKAWLYELHPTDYELLKKNIGKNSQVKIRCEEGLSGLLSLLPPLSRRGLVLIDSSYEIKSDYDHVFATINKACKKFSTGVYAIWYPVVDRQKIDKLVKKLVHSDIKDIQRFELGLSSDGRNKGMTSSGMIVINPPWGLFEKMSLVLPKLVKTLGMNDEAFFKCDILADE